MPDLNTILGTTSTAPSVGPAPAATQADVDAMTALAAQAKAARAELSPVAARMLAKRATVQGLTSQLNAAKGAR